MDLIPEITNVAWGPIIKEQVKKHGAWHGSHSTIGTKTEQLITRESQGEGRETGKVLGARSLIKKNESQRWGVSRDQI